MFKSEKLCFQILIFLFLSSCQKEQKNLPNDRFQNKNFYLNEKIPDSAKLGAKYGGTIVFDSKLDSIIKKVEYSPSTLKNNKYLFVYTFGPEEIMPSKIENYDEKLSQIFIPSKLDTINFDYKFKQSGLNKIVLIFLENTYYVTRSKDSIRVIDDYEMIIDSVIVSSK